MKPMVMILLVSFICMAAGGFTRLTNGQGKTAGAGQPAAAKKEQDLMALQETGMSKDLRLLRKTTLVSDGAHTRGSSKEAIEAAARVFQRVQFVGMGKEDVLWMLGDPKTISDYGRPIGPGADAPLLYRFDMGYGGLEFELDFREGRVVGLTKRGTY